MDTNAPLSTWEAAVHLPYTVIILANAACGSYSGCTVAIIFEQYWIAPRCSRSQNDLFGQLTGIVDAILRKDKSVGITDLLPVGVLDRYVNPPRREFVGVLYDVYTASKEQNNGQHSVSFHPGCELQQGTYWPEEYKGSRFSFGQPAPGMSP